MLSYAATPGRGKLISPRSTAKPRQARLFRASVSLRVRDVDDHDRGPDQQDHDDGRGGGNVVAHHDGGRANAHSIERRPRRIPLSPLARRAGGGTESGRSASARRRLVRGGRRAARRAAGAGRPAPAARRGGRRCACRSPRRSARRGPGHGGVVPRSEFGVGGDRRGDLVALVDVHAHTLYRIWHGGKETREIRVPVPPCPPWAGAPQAPEGPGGRTGGAAHPFGSIPFFFFLQVRPVEDRRMAASWHTGGMAMTDAVAAAGTAVQAVGEPCVVLKLGEVVLKGRNRQQFERMQQRNIKAAVEDTGVPTEVLHREGVVLVRVPREGRLGAGACRRPWRRSPSRAADVPGIVRVCRAWRVEKTPEAAVAAAVELTSAERPARSRCGRGAGTSGSRSPPPSSAVIIGRGRSRRRTGCR